MKTVNTICGPFDQKRYKQLRKIYLEADEHGSEKFTWEGNEWHTEFAKYMLEHLSNQFDDKKKA